MSKLDAKVFSSITPFSKQWILGEDTMYEFLYNYQEFLSDSYGIVDLGSFTWELDDGLFFAKVDSNYKPLVVADTPLLEGYCDKYPVINKDSLGQTVDKSINLGHNYYQIVIKDTSYASAADFKAAMSGVYLVYKLVNGVKRKSFIFNKDNQANITYFGTYSNLQTFYIDVGDTEHIASANIYLTSSNKNWVYKNYDEIDHSYRLQHGTEGFENIGRAYIFLTADNETAARQIINNDPVIVYCYYKQS